MGIRGRYPVLNAWDFINDFIQDDAELGPLFSFTNARTQETEYRIYQVPLDETNIKGTSFSTWFKGEAPYNIEFDKNVAVLYSDVAYQHQDIVTAIKETWKLVYDVIETLRVDANFGKSVEDHRIEGIEPVGVFQDGQQLWTFIIQMTHVIVPHGYIP